MIPWPDDIGRVAAQWAKMGQKVRAMDADGCTYVRLPSRWRFAMYTTHWQSVPDMEETEKNYTMKPILPTVHPPGRTEAKTAAVRGCHRSGESGEKIATKCATN